MLLSGWAGAGKGLDLLLAWWPDRLCWLRELTRLHFHRGPVCVTLALCIRYFQMKRVGSLNQVGQEEDRVMVRVIQNLL